LSRISLPTIESLLLSIASLVSDSEAIDAKSSLIFIKSG